jgi:type II secretory pathway component PulM
MSSSQPPSTREEKARFRLLGEKVKAMKREMEERKQEVKALKAKVARRQISDERLCLQNEESLKDRLNKRMHEHKSGMQRQSNFIEQVSASNKMLEEVRTICSPSVRARQSSSPRP